MDMRKKFEAIVMWCFTWQRQITKSLAFLIMIFGNYLLITLAFLSVIALVVALAVFLVIVGGISSFLRLLILWFCTQDLRVVVAHRFPRSHHFYKPILGFQAPSIVHQITTLKQSNRDFELYGRCSTTLQLAKPPTSGSSERCGGRSGTVDFKTLSGVLVLRNDFDPNLLALGK
jgi:hypothetical protein